jgi:3-dehydroquinate synthase
MRQEAINYKHSSTLFYFDISFSRLLQFVPVENSFFLTDENIFNLYKKELEGWKTIVIPAGEASKSLSIAETILQQLMDFGAGRDALLIGLGGGVVTDIAGFIAAIYKRGIRSAFVPTSVLGMVDAAIGGKNGLDFMDLKNIIGTIRQPEFLWYDPALLKTLPQEEWVNGFAEIIKHACILDKSLFETLENNSLPDFQNDLEKLSALIEKNALLKAKMVQEDEEETGKRKILNFGHTLAHAIENMQQLPHGHAVAMGMAFAAKLSEHFTGFKKTAQIIDLLKKYGLPVTGEWDKMQALQNMLQDKKMRKGRIDYVLLEDIGKPAVKPLSIAEIGTFIGN